MDFSFSQWSHQRKHEKVYLLKVGDKGATLTPTNLKFMFKFNINGSYQNLISTINPFVYNFPKWSDTL